MPATPTLYHYTSFDNAVKILQSGELWMFRTTGLSDPTEVRYGVNLLVDMLVESLASISGRKQKERLGSVLLNAYQVFGLQGDSRFTEELRRSMGMPDDVAKLTHVIDTAGSKNPDRYRAVYIASFSEESDSISQWRLYGDSGAGVCLGFDLRDEIHVTRHDNRKVPVKLGKVKYDIAATQKLFRKRIALIAEGATNIWKVAESCYRDAILLKQSDYAHEKEWRLMMYAAALKHSPSITTDQKRIRPYFPLHQFDKEAGSKMPLTEIRTGPLSSFKCTEDEDFRIFVLGQGAIAGERVKYFHSQKLMR